MTSPAVRVFDPDARRAPVTLSDFWREIAEPTFLADEASPRTLADYEGTVARWIELTGDPPLAEIDARLIADWRERLAERPGWRGLLSPATVNKHARTLRTLLKWAAEERLCEPPPRRSRRRRRRRQVSRPMREPFTRAEAEALLVRCAAKTSPQIVDTTGRLLVRPDEFWVALVLTTWWTGLRREVLLALEWSWLEKQVLRIPVSPMKGGRATAKWVHRQALDALEPLRESGRLKVFPWPARPQCLTRAFRRLAESARVWKPGRGLHALRCSHATEVFSDCGADAARAALDHKSADTTLAHYVAEEAQVDAALAAHRAAVESMPPLQSA